MKNLIKFEFRKLSKSCTFYICGSLAAFFVTINILSTYILAVSIGEMPTGSICLSFIQTAINNSNFTLLSAIFVSIFVCADQAGKTIKTIYAKGYSRTEVYFSKYIVSLIATIIYVLVAYIFSALFSFSLFGVEDITLPSDTFGLSFVAQLIMIITYHALYFFVSNSLGNTGGSIAICILGPAFVNIILSIFDLAIDSSKVSFLFSSYWLTSLLNVSQNSFMTFRRGIEVIIAGIIYSTLFIGGGYLINKTKEA